MRKMAELPARHWRKQRTIWWQSGAWLLSENGLFRSAICGQQSCNERSQRRAGNINRCVFSFKRARRCLVALFAYEQLKSGKQIFCLLGVKCYRSHALCIYKVAISASTNELEASIAAFSATKEGDVASSSSRPWTKERIASRYFYCG